LKNILVPTDFSYCAADALATAALFAQQFNASIHLLHVMTPADHWPKGKASTEERKALDDLELQQTMTSLQELASKYKGINFNLKAEAGSLVDTVAKYAKDEDVDLIIMGSHGVGGKQEFFIGSNTQKVIRQVRHNVLVVKDTPSELNFKRVIFASNFDERDKDAFLRFKKFVAPFSPEVHLVHINTDPFFELPYGIMKGVMAEAETLFAPLKVKSHYLKDFSVDAGVRHLSENIDADLIGISNHVKHPLKRIFSGSNVEALVNHSEIPVLSLDFVD